MKKTIILYALLLAALTALLKFFEYRYWIRDLSLEFYLGLVATVFTALGIWAGIKLTRKQQPATTSSFDPSQAEAAVQSLGLSKRELEVLALVAAGCSNQEIAERLFLSPNTVKTHLSNLFTKLDVRRRTQAIQKAKTLNLIS